MVQNAIASEFFARFADVNREMNIKALGCRRTRAFLKGHSTRIRQRFFKDSVTKRLRDKVVDS